MNNTYNVSGKNGGNNRWNKSTCLNKKLTERRKMENFIHDPSNRFAFNFRAEELDTLKNPSPLNREPYCTLVQTSKRVEEMPNSYKLLDAKPWNFEANYSGQSLLASRKMCKVNSEKTLKAVEWCKCRHDKLINYTNPVQSTELLQNKIRELKKSGNFQSQLSLGRTTSLESINAANEFILKQSRRNRNNNGSSDYSPSRGTRAGTAGGLDSFSHSTYSSSSTIPPITCKYSNDRSSAYTVYKHSGVWEYSEREQRYMWSDTGSFDFDSRGDVAIRINPDAYNYVGPTIKNTVHTVT